MDLRLRRLLGLTAAWVLAVCLAVGVGLVVVGSLGDSLEGRGPLGDTDTGAGVPSPPSRAEVDASGPGVRDRFGGHYGRLVVACHGPYASVVTATAREGWHVTSFEPGPDDDVDASFTDGHRRVDLEVFCDDGRPTLAELERTALTG